MAVTIAIGDLHFPWGDDRVIRGIAKLIKELKPNNIVQIGDLYDFFSYTKFARSQNVLTPNEEVESGRKDALRFWQLMRDCAPKASCYQLMGNHDIRPIKRITDKAPEFENLIAGSWEQLFKFPGVDVVWDARDDLELDGVIYEHGFYGQPGRHCRENMKSTVMGHTHRAWCHYEWIRGLRAPIWELNVGYAADPTQKPLQYPRKKHTKWTPGVGLIDGLGPRFIPHDWM